MFGLRNLPVNHWNFENVLEHTYMLDIWALKKYERSLERVEHYSWVSNKRGGCNKHVGWKQTLKMISVQSSINTWLEFFLKCRFEEFK